MQQPYTGTTYEEINLGVVQDISSTHSYEPTNTMNDQSPYTYIKTEEISSPLNVISCEGETGRLNPLNLYKPINLTTNKSPGTDIPTYASGGYETVHVYDNV